MSERLRRDLGFVDGDAVYERLVAFLADLDEEEARLALAKLCLLLANHIGDEAVLDEALAAARKDV
tara:strand:+ start:394 stop:591 length:198 start_codon:yes stop_codon:yes gene_type:complete